MTRTPPRKAATLSAAEHAPAPPLAGHDGEGGNLSNPHQQEGTPNATRPGNAGNPPNRDGGSSPIKPLIPTMMSTPAGPNSGRTLRGGRCLAGAHNPGSVGPTPTPATIGPMP